MKKELCVKLVIYKDYTEMHGQQNIKYWTNNSIENYITQRDGSYQNYRILNPWATNVIYIWSTHS